MTRDRNKARRQHKNQAEDQLLLFQLPTRFRHTVYHPSLLSPAGLSEELFISTFFQKQTFLSHSDHLLIPNPEYQSRNSSIPCYAAFRLKGMVSAGQQETLYTLVQNVWDVGLRSHTVASRGADFHQWWFGVWCRYAKHSVISADSRQKGSQKEVLELVKAFDGIFGDKPRSMLHRLDKKVAISMAHNHWHVHNYLKGLKTKYENKTTPTDRATQMPSSFRKTAESLDSTHSEAKAIRLGGMGMMLAVSWGEGTEWHIDAKDYGHHYTIVSVLTSPAVLHLPELGCTIPVYPGDVVGFLAHRYLHKLEPLPAVGTSPFIKNSAAFMGITPMLAKYKESVGSVGNVGESVGGEAGSGSRRQVVFTC